MKKAPAFIQKDMFWSQFAQQNIDIYTTKKSAARRKRQKALFLFTAQQ